MADMKDKLVTWINRTINKSLTLKQVAEKVELDVDTYGDIAAATFKIDKHTYSVTFEDITAKIS